MKKLALLLFLLVAGIASTPASVTINYGFGDLYSGQTTSSAAFPAGGLLNLLRLESGSWSALGDLNLLFSNLTNSFAPSGAVLMASSAADAAGQVSGSWTFDLSPGNPSPDVGDQLLLVAYPTLTLSSLSPGLNTPGFFFRTSAVIDGSDIAWVTPSDGSTVTLGAYNLSLGGSVPNGQFTAGNGAAAGSAGDVTGGGFTTVPEPSTYALLGVSALALGAHAIRRRLRCS